MKKAKRVSVLISAVVLIFAIAVSMAGCSAPSAPTSVPTSAPPTADSSTTAPPETAALPESQKPEAAPITLDIGLLGTSIKPVGVIVAEAMGYFEEEGVIVNFQKVSSMNDAYLAVSTGALDVYLFSSTAAATFISQGTTTLRVFGGTAGEGSEIMAAAGKDYVIEMAEDFVGLRIACSMPETGQMVLKDYLIRQGYTIGAPGEEADVTFVYINDSGTAIEGCIKGEYDLCITNSSLGYYAGEYGVEVVATVRDFVETYPCCRQTCNQETYEKEFDALVKFEIATLRGHEFYLNDMEETLDILEEYSGEDREFLRAQIYGTDDYSPVMRLSLDPDKAACVAFYEALSNLGEIENSVSVDWDEYVVTDVYKTALDTLAEREPDSAVWGELTDYFNTHN